MRKRTLESITIAVWVILVLSVVFGVYRCQASPLAGWGDRPTEYQLGFPGYRGDDGLWRADLKRIDEPNLELFKAINARTQIDDQWTWIEPEWNNKSGWTEGEDRRPYPKFKKSKKQVCYETYCELIDTLIFTTEDE